MIAGWKLSTGISVQVALGTQEQNLSYISKESPPTIVGQPMKSGSRKDIAMVATLITGTASSPVKLAFIARTYPETFIRHHRGIERLMAVLNDEPRKWVTEVKVYIGPTETGKSRKAHDEDKIQWTHHGDRWFDLYEGQDRVLFDDFEGVKSGVPYRKLLQLLDRYPLYVPVKGGFVNWRPKLVVITTNVEPSEWYPDQTDITPLTRRITSVTRFATL